MIVVDASALIELLLSTELGHAVADRLDDAEMSLHIPHLADLEIAQVSRRLVRSGQIDARRGAQLLDDLRDLDLERHGHEPLLDRIWTLRENLTAYDAVYIALAEALDTTLLTCDRRIATAPRLSRRVELIG